MHVLFVCTGNICRSPTAERLTSAYAAANLPDPTALVAASAGTRAVVDQPMESTAELVLVGLGGTGAGFTARQLLPELVDAADLVITMTRLHRSTVLNTSPRALSRTFTLREAAALLRDVPQELLPGPADLDLRGRALVEQLARRRANRVTHHDRSDDIGDPIGRDARMFLRIGDEIAESLLPILAVLCAQDR